MFNKRNCKRRQPQVPYYLFVSYAACFISPSRFIQKRYLRNFGFDEQDGRPKELKYCYRAVIEGKQESKYWLEMANEHLHLALSPKKHRIIMYTDASVKELLDYESCCKAAIGIWFGDGDPRNVAESVEVQGFDVKHAEVLAVIRALQKIATSVTAETRDVIIYSDCIDIHKSYQRYVQLSPYLQYLLESEINNFQTNFPHLRLLIEYVKAHTGIYGNEQADKLARSVHK